MPLTQKSCKTKYLLDCVDDTIDIMILTILKTVLLSNSKRSEVDECNNQK